MSCRHCQFAGHRDLAAAFTIATRTPSGAPTTPTRDPGDFPPGTAVQDREKVAFSVPIASNSEVACNEKRFDNDWTAVFGFIKSFIKSGGGIIN